MSNTENRRRRRTSGATGAYIALILAATVLAVAGYRTLIPRAAAERESVPPAAPAETAAPRTPETVPETMPEIETEIPAEPPRQTQRAVRAQGPAQIRVSEAEDAPPAAAAPAAASAPSLVVPPLTGATVAAFSMEELQYSETMGDWRTHNGVDIAAEAGTPVCAAASGTVLDVRDDDLMGATVVISHEGGLETVYANLQALPAVETGDYVTAGQVIGAVGRTALSEAAQGAHLHFSVTRDGAFVDPAAYLNGG